MTEFLVRNNAVASIATFVLLVAGLVYTTTLGIRVGRRLTPSTPDDQAAAAPGIAAVEAAVFGLFGLLLAFTFSTAASRFQARKELIRAESQAIATAWSHLELLSEPARSDLRGRFRDYVDTRVSAHSSMEGREEGIAEAERLGAGIVVVAAAACKTETLQSAAEVVMPAITAMTEAALARKAAVRNHPPVAIFGLLLGLSVCAAFMVGMAMAPAKRHSRLHILAFGLSIGATLYVTVDIELPRLGMIRVDDTDLLLHEVRKSMDEPTWN